MAPEKLYRNALRNGCKLKVPFFLQFLREKWFQLNTYLLAQPPTYYPITNSVYVPSYLFTYLCTNIPTHPPLHLPTKVLCLLIHTYLLNNLQLPTYLSACLPTYLPTYLPRHNYSWSSRKRPLAIAIEVGRLRELQKIINNSESGRCHLG